MSVTFCRSTVNYNCICNCLENTIHNEETSPFPEETWLLIFQYATYNSGTTYANIHLTCHKWHRILIDSQTSPLVRIVNTIRPHLTKPRVQPFIDDLFFEFPTESNGNTEIKVTLLWYQNVHTFYKLLPVPTVKVSDSQAIKENKATQKIQCGLEMLIEQAIKKSDNTSETPDELKKFPWQYVLANPNIPLTIKGH